MGNKIRALIWEECRVSGAISLTCWLSGSLVVILYSLRESPVVIAHDPLLFLGYVCGVPLGAAALLLLNPDTSGSMKGGFSRRILDLPVQTYIPVTVSLVLRSAFIFVLSLLTLLVAQLQFTNLPGIGLALSFTAIYLGIQMLDWMRAPISGFSTFLIAAALGMFIFFMVEGGSFGKIIFEIGGIPDDVHKARTEIAISLTVFAVFVYLVSLIAVHNTRKGRVRGIPEIWQWHTYLSIPNQKLLKPFKSPIAAQVWMDLCKSYFLLPVVTVVVTIFTYGTTWIHWKTQGLSSESFGAGLWESMVPFGAMSLGVFAQGLVLNVLGYRYTKGMTGYSYLLPMTDAQFAYARVATLLILFLPTVVFVTIVHFVIPNAYFITELIPMALQQDVTSLREVVWTLLGRSFVVGLILWAVVSVSTRLIGKSLGIAILASIALGLLEYANLIGHNYIDVLTPICMIILCLGAYVHAFRSRLIGKRSIIFWLVVWAIASWPFLGPSVVDIAHVSSEPSHYIAAILSSLAIGALAPLPFVAIVLDIRKKRHSAAPRQNQKESDPFGVVMTTSMKGWAVGAACITLFVVWLGWPARPAYEDLWHSKGYPVTLAELDEWYAAVPENENRALKYMSMVEDKNEKNAAFQLAMREIDKTNVNFLDGGYFRLLYVWGGAEYEPNNGIPSDKKEATEHYWRDVSQHFAPRLIEIANDGDVESRYQINLLNGQTVELGMLAQLRDMARQLKIDAYHWVFVDDAAKATDSLLAIFPVGESLRNEPIVISGLVRIAISGIGIQAIQDTMNMTTYSESDLIRIQNELEALSATFEKEPIMRRPMVGESAITMNSLANISSYLALEGDWNSAMTYAVASGLPMLHAVSPRGAEIMVSGTRFNRILDNMQQDWFALHELSDDNSWEKIGSMAILSMILMPALDRADGASWRMRTEFDLAITGVAVERYRIENGQFPETLDALVPDYMDAVLMDKFDPDGHALRYRIGDDGEAITYSVSRDMVDDGGVGVVTENRRSREGDMLFTVYPNKSNDMEYVEEPGNRN